MSVVSPGRREFHRLAAEWTVVPVWRELVADLTTPVAAFVRTVGDEPGFLLESVEHGERWSRFSFIGRRPLATLVARGRQVSATGQIPAETPLDQGILAAIDHILGQWRSPAMSELPPLHGGLMGYLGYDVVREVEHLPNAPLDDQGLPDAVMSVIGELAVFDHWRQRVTLIENVIIPAGASSEDVDEAYDRAIAALQELADDGARPLVEPLLEPPGLDEELPEVLSSMGSQSFCDAVEAAKEHILAGDIFQVVLAQRYDFDLEAQPFDVYRSLRQVNPSPYMYFVRLADVSLVGCSPEPMVQLLDGQVISRPIAGTRRRGRTEAEDRRMAAELSEHPKEIAEHIMLLDLARNDVGRVVAFGTETVDEMMTLERYSHVMHLTSQVSGQLAPGQ
ncbi:MAG: chorismate-binding protein, partial [bacterium]|nr:chorismate-binding protein [bacterium]